jgi:antitoxin MazE
VTVKTSIVRLGSKYAVRIPKALLDEAGLSGEVELRVEAGRIIVEPCRNPRAGWEEAAARLVAEGGDELLIGDFVNDWDDEDWTWPGEKE